MHSLVNAVPIDVNDQLILDCREIEYGEKKQSSFLIPMLSSSSYKDQINFSIKMDDTYKT